MNKCTAGTQAKRPQLIGLLTKAGCMGLAAWAIALGCGCGEGDVRFGGLKVRKVTVRPVTIYGMNLDASATPEQVAFSALQAIRDDFQAENGEERAKAIDAQFDLAAAGLIAKRNRTKLDNDEWVHDVVYHWTPTIAYYAGDFPKTLEEAQGRLVRREGKDDEIELAMKVADPSGNANAAAVMRIFLAKDTGMWRVLHFGFDRAREIRTASAGKE